ncbi:hypothetical protein ACQP04_09100 [Pseudonocardia halophobica]|uniref:hypothetical protein n=1 Tax=Pseudonocardia halophobica TaxID=29401 RepID=UPI003D938147
MLVTGGTGGRPLRTPRSRALEAEAESLERRLERRLDTLDGRLARIEERLATLGEDDRSGR